MREAYAWCPYDSRAMPESVHVHAPHELAEPGEATTTRERWLEIAAALLLSLATLGIAWSGYQAAKWSGLQARRYTQASSARSLANQAATLAGEDRTQDLLNFNRWLEVHQSATPRSPPLRATLPRRVPACVRVLARERPVRRPGRDPRVPSWRRPTCWPTRKEPSSSNRSATLRFEQGKEATEHADDYVFVTVFFAVVLFFAGISLRFAWFPMRILILSLGR